VPARRTGAMSPGASRQVVLSLRLRIDACTGIDAVLTSAAGSPLRLRVALVGRGGPGAVTVEVPELAELVRSLVRARCTTG
jgi:hypothetical protein